MKLAVAVLVLLAVMATETFAFHNVQSYYVPSVSSGSYANSAYDNSLNYRKSIDAAERGSSYNNQYYRRPSYYPNYNCGGYYNNCGYRRPRCNYNPCRRPCPRPYYCSRPSYYGQSSGSNYQKDLRYRKSLDKRSRGRSSSGSYYNSDGDSDYYY